MNTDLDAEERRDPGMAPRITRITRIQTQRRHGAEPQQLEFRNTIVRGRKVTVKIDGKTVIEYNEPPVDPTARGKKLGEGPFTLQAHDPKSIIHYKNIRVKRPE